MMWAALIAGLSTVAFLGVGVFDVVFRLEENACEMTYMWELPEYLVGFLVLVDPGQKIPRNKHTLLVPGWAESDDEKRTVSEIS